MNESLVGRLARSPKKTARRAGTELHRCVCVWCVLCERVVYVCWSHRTVRAVRAVVDPTAQMLTVT